MLRKWMLPIVAMLALGTAATAQTPWQFHWQTGQVLVYRVEHVSTATEVVGDAREETKTTLNLTRRWQVLGVDPSGVATLQMSITALRTETIKANGDVLLFDSANVDKSTQGMREAMAKYLNQPLALLRVDGAGKVVEVKESKFGPASRYESSSPFVVVLPGAVVKAGLGWERTYTITLEPPQGAGEKYPAVQQFACKEIKGALAILQLTTTVKTPPSTPADRVPLMQSLPEGEVVFDTQSGLLRSARLRIDKEEKGYQGEGSSYRLQSTYSEEYTGDK